MIFCIFHRIQPLFFLNIRFTYKWERENGSIIKVRNLWFLHMRDDVGNVLVEDGYDAKSNQILTESKHKLIEETIAPILDLQEQWNRLKH